MVHRTENEPEFGQMLIGNQNCVTGVIWWIIVTSRRHSGGEGERGMRMTAVNWMNCTHCQPDCVKTYLRIVQGVICYHALYTFSYFPRVRRLLKITSSFEQDIIFSDVFLADSWHAVYCMRSTVAKQIISYKERILAPFRQPFSSTASKYGPHLCSRL